MIIARNVTAVVNRGALTVAVVGPGAIGTVIAAALHEKGSTPIVAGRTRRNGLRVVMADRDIVIPGTVLTEPTQITATVDVVFLAVKATQVGEAEVWLRVLCGSETVVCVLQNGVEQVAMVSPLVPMSAVVPAVVWFPAVRHPDGVVHLPGRARISIPDCSGARIVRKVLSSSLCEVDVSADFAALAWRKLAQNAAAGLMAVTGRRSGVFMRADIAALTAAYLTEIQRVARAAGVDLSSGELDVILEQFRSWPEDRGTSILTDREAGNPLEWDVRNGVIQRLGRQLSVPTPISDVIVPLLAATSDGPG